MVSRTIPVAPFDLVIFGATGDLSKRKILPSLFARMRSGQMPETARIIGAAKRRRVNRQSLSCDPRLSATRYHVRRQLVKAGQDSGQGYTRRPCLLLLGRAIAV